MRRLVLALAVLGCALSTASAQVTVGATPVHHGVLDVRPARGTFDPEGGTATLKVGRWKLIITPDSNGIYPDQETVVIAIGEQSFSLPPGSLRASRNGKVFSYRAPKGDASPVPQPIRSLRIKRARDGSYAVRFSLVGIDLSQLILQDPVCMPTAVLVGDDDGFTGVSYSRPTFESRRLKVPSDCDVGNDWPWA